MTNSVPVYLLLNDKIQTNLSDYINIIKYIDVFGKIFTGAGFHKIDMCWLDKNLIGVVRDDYTKNVKDLKTMAKANRLPDVEYKLIDRSTLSGPKVRYSIWVRYGATPAEEKNWQEMKTKLLKLCATFLCVIMSIVKYCLWISQCFRVFISDQPELRSAPAKDKISSD